MRRRGVTRALAALAAVGGLWHAAAAQTDLGAGERAFLRRCTRCHSLALSLQQARTFPEWRETVRRMARYADGDGLRTIPPAEWDAIARFLAEPTRLVGEW